MIIFVRFMFRLSYSLAIYQTLFRVRYQITRDKFKQKTPFLGRLWLLCGKFFYFWPKLNFVGQTIRSLSKVLIFFDKNFDFLTKISIFDNFSTFDKNIDCWQTYRFLTKISIFFSRFRFLTTISIFDKKNSIFDKNFDFW